MNVIYYDLFPSKSQKFMPQLGLDCITPQTGLTQIATMDRNVFLGMSKNIRICSLEDTEISILNSSGVYQKHLPVLALAMEASNPLTHLG